ncbi:helix-turn-helix domain-containing protein [Convivina praedatoris]|uniref:Replication protein n=1 Tax=Convivina praedatoris TaxID=2880963 RepID=A0ABN8H9Z8_9LACO|nr:helix-turn-helix domain-containing protein [Convivina sp. LMG 32447]CAH1855906.1 hypothetical protein LMG032447_01194 [Convivina sp. LMG 32447]
MQKSVLKINRKVGFTQVYNSAVNDCELSLQAKGLLLEMLSKPDDWVFYKSNMQDWASNGREATQNAFKELEEKGYVSSRQLQNADGKFGNLEISVYDYPLTENRSRETGDGKPVNGKPATTNTNITNTNNNTKSNTTPTPSQGSETPKPSSRKLTKSETGDFEKLWQLYPKKVGKGGISGAMNAYRKAIRRGTTNKEIQDGIMAYREKLERDGTESRFIKNGSTWFNQRGWEDDYSVPITSKQSDLDRLAAQYGDW